MRLHRRRVEVRPIVELGPRPQSKRDLTAVVAERPGLGEPRLRPPSRIQVNEPVVQEIEAGVHRQRDALTAVEGFRILGQPVAEFLTGRPGRTGT